MCNFRLSFVLLATVVFVTSLAAQTQPSAPAPTAQQVQRPRPPAEAEERDEDPRKGPPPPASYLPPDTPVIIIKGLCEPSRGGAVTKKEDCKTAITRAEFEKLADTLQPNMPAQVRKQLADTYPQILYSAQEARKRGLEKDPHYLELLKFTKMELLKLELERSLTEQAGKIPEADIDAFYEKNSKNYEEASLQRIFVPKARQSDVPKEGATPAEMEAARKDSEAVMAKLADDLHVRAVNGEDFDKLQKEAYEGAAVKSTPPPTSNPKVRRNGLPSSQATIFDLKPGEISPVLSEPQGFYIYRMVTKNPLPLAQVKNEIRDALRSQRLDAVRAKMRSAVSADLNPAYFGPEAAGGPGLKPSEQPRPMPSPQPQQ